jgi:hypothetical protein
MKKIELFPALVLCAALASPAHAVPNLLANGSFEAGGGTLSSWTTSGTQIAFPPAVIVTNGVTGSAFGEAIPADNAVTNSPDASGTHGVYFVDDRANQFLTQSVFLTPGSYEIGFDAYAPQNGFNNAGDASFTGIIAGVTLANYTVHTQNTPRVWINFSGLANIVAAGNYGVSFEYQTFGGASADVVIDRVYIVSSSQSGGTDIPALPEPVTLALFGSGLAALGMARRRRG